MLTWDDCVALYDPTKEEIRALAAGERASPVSAEELGAYLVYAPHGTPCLSPKIVGDIKAAHDKGDRLEELKLKAVLRHFIERHQPAPSPVACCCC